jgi:rare lipoprotein A
MRARGVRPGVVAVALLAALAGCATPRGGVSAPPTVTGTAQTGQASWYGVAHQGRLTASGEPYDMYRLTAAHLTLPLGTHVLVTNIKNGRSVEVRVNDRGPTVAGRIIDLSYAAARALDAIGEGVIPVRLRILSMPSR